MTTLEAQALLFDLDGTLVDSTVSVERHWRMFAGWHNLDAEKILLHSHGVPHTTTIRRELATASPEEVAAVLARFEKLEEDDAVSEAPLPGALELLATLPDRGWAVVTSCWRTLAIARASVAQIRLPNVVIPVDEVEHGKPAPDGYLKAAEALGVDPSQCIVFEDAPSGIAAAIAAGSMPVALKTTTPEDRLRSAMQGTGVLVDDLRQVRIETTDEGFLVHIIS